MKEGSWSEGRFETTDGCYFRALGRGQSPRGLKNNGNRPDYILTDDLDDDEMCRNPRRVNEATQWVLSALFGTMEAGRGRFIMVGNRIAQNSVPGHVIDRPGVHHTRVNQTAALLEVRPLHNLTARGGPAATRSNIKQPKAIK